MAALAPMPRASVRATVIHSAGTRHSDRTAIFRSRKNDIAALRRARNKALIHDLDLPIYVDINRVEWMSRPSGPLPSPTTLGVRDCPYRMCSRICSFPSSSTANSRFPQLSQESPDSLIADCLETSTNSPAEPNPAMTWLYW